MDDEELVEAIRRGDRTAVAELYRRYSPRLHAFCRRVLNEDHLADDAVQDTFVVATARIDQLRDPSRLRAWLYAIARNECTRHGRLRGRLVPVEELPVNAPVAGDEVARSAEAGDVAEMLWEAAAGLDERDRVLLELSVRHGLEGRELADAAGVAPGQISMATGRMRERVERSLGALLVARRGRQDCPGLRAVLSDWDGTFSVLMRKRVARHVDRCDVCERKRTALVAPLASLAAAPFAAPPAELADRVLAAVDRMLDGQGATPSERAEPAGAAESTGSVATSPAMTEVWPDGFPPATAVGGRSRPIAIALAAATLLVIAGLVGLVLAGSDDHGRSESAAGPVGGPPTPDGAGGAGSDSTAVGGSTAPETTTAIAASSTVADTAAAGGEAGPTEAVTAPTVVTEPPVAPAPAPAPGPTEAPGPIVLNPGQTPGPEPTDSPPTLGVPTRSGTAAMQNACNPANSVRTITASVTDDAAQVSVTLHWSGAHSGSKPMVGGSSRTASLGAFPLGTVGEVTWWVVAIDDAGQRTLSPTASVTVDPCPG